MTLSMARCIGEAGCDGEPTSRGLCHRCYARHSYRGTIDNFPTMRERTRELLDRGMVPVVANPIGRQSGSTSASQLQANMRYRAARRAERVEIDGILVHPSNRHGHVSTYNATGCQGAMCRESLRHYRRTGETCLPAARHRNVTPEDWLTYDRSWGQS